MGANPGKELWEAAKQGDVEKVESLLNSKADVNYKNESGRTPLHVASSGGHSAVVSVLLARNAIPTIQDKDRRSALHYASAWGHQSVVELLLNSKANINLQDKYGDTPLHYASSSGQAAVVEVLLARNADPTIKNEVEMTARGFAVLQNQDAVIKLLDFDKETDLVDGELLTMLKELDISEPEVRAREFAKDKLTLERLRTLPYDLIEKECLAHGMAKGEMFAFAGKLKTLASKSPPSTTTVKTIATTTSTTSSTAKSTGMRSSVDDKIADVEAHEDFLALFPYRLRDKIPFTDPQFTQLPPNVISQFKDLCSQQHWYSVEQLLNNYQEHIATSPCLKDPKLQQWLSGLQTRVYPALINKEDLVVGQRLGGREFGDVCIAEWKLSSSSGGKLLVAYKKLSQVESEEITPEFNTWTPIPPHVNIARLYGAVWEGEGKRITGLVAEFRTRGSLADKLKSGMSESTVLTVLLGVAQGLQHLHIHNIINRDIFARNILLNQKLVPTITDFSLSRNAPYALTGTRIIPRGAAPEVLQTRAFTFESDIYCLGVLVWEMTHPGKPVPEDELVFRGSTEVEKIALRCSQADPGARPSLDQVIKMCTDAIDPLYREVTEQVKWDNSSNSISQHLVTGNWRELRGTTADLLTRIEADLLRRIEQGLIYISEQPLFFELAVFCNMRLRVLSKTPPSRWSKEQRDEFNALCAISRDYARLLSHLGESSYGPIYFAESRWVIVYLLAQSERWEKNFKDVLYPLDVKTAEAKVLRVIASKLSPTLWAIYHQFLPKDIDQPKKVSSNKRISFIKKPLNIYSTTTRREITGDEDWISAKWILRIWQLNNKSVPVPPGINLSSTLSKRDEKWLGQLGWSFQKPRPPPIQDIPQEQQDPGAFFRKLDKEKFQEVVARKKSNKLGTYTDQENEVKQWLHAVLTPKKAELLFAQGFDDWNSIFHLLESDLANLTRPPSPPAAPPRPPHPVQPEDEQSREQASDEQKGDQQSDQPPSDQPSNQQRECSCRITSPDTAMVWTNNDVRQQARTVRNGHKILNIIDSRVPFAYRVCLYATQDAAQEAPELEEFLRERLGCGLAEHPGNCKVSALANILRSETVVMHMCRTILCDDSRDQFLTAFNKGSGAIVPVFLQVTHPQVPREHLLLHWEEMKALETSPRIIQSTGNFDSVPSLLIEELQLEPPPDLRVNSWLRKLNPKYEKYVEPFAKKGFDTLEGFRGLKITDEPLFPDILPGHFRIIVEDVHQQPDQRSYWREFIT